jgi:hypothetical protein
MRSIYLATAFLAAAALATGLGIPAAKAEDLSAELALSPKDHKYNSRACRDLRAQAKNFNDGLFQQKPEAYALAAIVPGGSVGLLIYVQQKRVAFKTKVQQACMTNPPGGASATSTEPEKKAAPRKRAAKAPRQAKAN